MTKVITVAGSRPTMNKASPLFVQGVGNTMAIHLVCNYAEMRCLKSPE